MSERQVQYTDGSWSREVEVGHVPGGEPDLLDGITDSDDLPGRVRAVMRALRNLEAERDAARGKLDKVRDLAHQPIGFRVNGSFEPVIRTRDVLAILDGKTGD